MRCNQSAHRTHEHEHSINAINADSLYNLSRLWTMQDSQCNTVNRISHDTIGARLSTGSVTIVLSNDTSVQGSGNSIRRTVVGFYLQPFFCSISTVSRSIAGSTVHDSNHQAVQGSGNDTIIKSTAGRIRRSNSKTASARAASRSKHRTNNPGCQDYRFPQHTTWTTHPIESHLRLVDTYPWSVLHP